MPSTRLKKYRYPLRNGNSFKLLVDGDTFFSKMLQSIDQAQDYILLEQYLVNSDRLTDRFINSLNQAAQRGVSIYLMLDDFGVSSLTQNDRTRLTQAGIKICLFNPVRFKHFFHSLFRNHRKSMVIDGQLAFVGGAGLAEEFSAELNGAQAWHDVMLEVKGMVVQDWCQLFTQTWQKHSTQSLSLPSSPSQAHMDNMEGRLLTASPFKFQEINRALIKHLRRCKQRAWVTTPYFVAPRKIRRNLRQAARRGVDVRLLLPGPYSDHPWISHAARRHYMRFLKNQVRIFEYQPRFTHAKIELCDDWVSLGSSNLDRWNQHWNLDANQAIYNRNFAEAVAGLFMADFAASKEITLQAWCRRPWYTRIRESLSGLLVFWLERLGRLYK